MSTGLMSPPREDRIHATPPDQDEPRATHRTVQRRQTVALALLAIGAWTSTLWVSGHLDVDPMLFRVACSCIWPASSPDWERS
jgi:hypothetical protein